MGIFPELRNEEATAKARCDKHRFMGPPFNPFPNTLLVKFLYGLEISTQESG